MTTRNQNKIIGTYAIVSVFQANRARGVNVDVHEETMLTALIKGFKVQEMHGKWDGVEELSIRLEGIGAEAYAEKLAQKHSQQAYIAVNSGRAFIVDTATGETIAAYDNVVEVEDADNYSEVQGFRFKFA